MSLGSASQGTAVVPETEGTVSGLGLDDTDTDTGRVADGSAAPVAEGTVSGLGADDVPTGRAADGSAAPGAEDAAPAAAPVAEAVSPGPSEGGTTSSPRADAVPTGQAADGAAAPHPAPHPTAEGDPVGGAPATTTRPTATPPPATTARRPGDAAREALRAARAEALRAQAEEETRRPARKPVRKAPPVPAEGTPAAARAQAVREVRDFLATAFRMPTWEDAPEDTPEDDSTAEVPDPAPEFTYPRPAEPEPVQAAPHVPATMATPHRDNELRRTFPAFAPRAETDGFAETWWGNAWVEALERGALDPKRVARGRGYADAGNVDAITVTPGQVLAYVRGSRPRPYRVQVTLPTLRDADWERFLDAAVDRPGHIAALLDKELPHSLADCGAPLLPGPAELNPRCTCPDSGHPCKHAAALCYQTARLLDADPFVLLLLRGRGERELLDTLSRRSAAHAARAAREGLTEDLPGVRATEALAERRLPPPPPPLPAPAHPEQPPVYPAAPGGPDPFALDQLATDAAARAHALLTTGRDPVGGLTLWQDAVRLAAARPGSGLTAATRALYATLASAAGRIPSDLARAVAAWRQGGLAGLDVLEEPWNPPAGRFDRARPLLIAAGLPPFRPWHNHLTHPLGHVQLRFGRDGLWYAYESEPGQDDWWPRGTPALDPVDALTGLDALAGL
ncbi:SWIM zinc finger family protein [Streptomyces sp. NPDC048242]|uniref:SWIM zinc finger family protein n=1 Tax=Streptomyces sp. NPDC048242 TaxID=3155026 RepID=UPI00343C9C97